jgi:chorismate dehydratase
MTATPRISASSYSNTAPLVWSYLYGSQRGRVELILDNAPARSAELLDGRRVDAALVPVIVYQSIADLLVVPGICVGARQRVRSVCLVTRGGDLANVRSVALDVSSRTSVVLTKLIFVEFLGFEPKWIPAEPEIDGMLSSADAALIIGDPALALSTGSSAIGSDLRIFDLAELWDRYTGLGFVFAMWMTRQGTAPADLAAARDEGVRHIDSIAANYADQIGLSQDQMREYLSSNISYNLDERMQKGLELYFTLAQKNRLTEGCRPLVYTKEGE